MSTSRRTSLSKSLNRLLGVPCCVTGSGVADRLADHLKVLEETVDADAYTILQVNRGQRTARVLAQAGLRTPSGEGEIDLEIPRIAQQIAEFPDVPALALKGPFPSDPFLSHEATRSLLLRPMTAGEKCLVTVALRRKPKAFTPTEIERFAAVSGVVNMANLLCQFFEEDAVLMGTDKLTGLGLFSDFHENMIKELSRARRGGGTVTMGIMSIVPSESVTTEEILLNVTRSFKGQLRNFDTLDRYGPMQIAFILPDLRSSEGERVVGRFVGEIVSSLGGKGTAPDIYVGISCYPEDGATVERLIEMAEAALSQALEESRPGVYRWTETADR